VPRFSHDWRDHQRYQQQFGPSYLTANQKAHKELRPLLLEAVARNIKVSAKEYQLFRNEDTFELDFKDLFADPPVAWIITCVPLELRNSFAPYHLNIHADYIDDEGKAARASHFRQLRRYQIPKSVVEAEEHHLAMIIGNIKPNPRKYQILPECRTCYTLFGSFNDLKRHLDGFPEHRRIFKHKVRNIVRNTDPGRKKVVCFTCWYKPETLSELHYHFGNYKEHKRWGLLPRWREDNDEWSEKPRRSWEKKNGRMRRRS
jgi:hypothetical protein